MSIKTAEEIQKMRRAGRLAAEVLLMIEPFVQAGVSTEQLNVLCHDYIVNEQKAIPAPLNYNGFPKSICTSVNHVACHGIPSETEILQPGDIINIDVTVIKDGYHGDVSKMFFVGEPSDKAAHVVEIARECLFVGIDLVKPGMDLGTIGHAIEQHALTNACSIVREYCGHGIGLGFQEDPQILHYGTPGVGLILEAGMTFTIEPIVNFGKPHTRLMPDNWAVVTKDKSLSAQWEHTLLVTEDGVEILTLTEPRP